MTRLAAALVLLLTGSALAEPPAPMEDRARILAIEMRRGPAEDLGPYLLPGANPLSRQLAIRALGRIGDRGRAWVLLALLLREETEDLRLALWAAGIAQTETLAKSIREHLASEDPLVAAAAAEALGFSGAEGAAGDIAKLLHHESAHVRAGALRGLARIRPEAMLERLVPFLTARDDLEREAAEYAVWKTAEERARVAKARSSDWAGERRLMSALHAWRWARDPESRLTALRALAPVLAGPPPVPMLTPGDPRDAQEMIRRFYTDRDGAFIDRMLAMLLDHEDAKVRHLAAEALGAHGTAEPLSRRFGKERDLRVRDVIAVALARCGDESAWRAIANDPARRAIEPVTRGLAEARVLLASPRKEAFGELCARLTPREGHEVPDALTVRVLWEVGKRDDPALGPLLERLVFGPGSSRDPHVFGAALGLMVANRMYGFHREGDRTVPHGLLVDTCGLMFPIPDLSPEAHRYLAGALGGLAEDEANRDGIREWSAFFLRRYLEGDRYSAWTRLAARESAVALGLPDVPDEASLPANDWRGLPRPEKPVLGLDLSGEGEWLDETEILRLADRIAEVDPRVVVKTTAGTMKLKLLPEQAPVHCASLVLSAVRGTYANTRWHRVVPSFVIQGGDPHGHGAGDAGFTIPDEISAIRYRRGDLGMPKSRKDDGGCQLFIMHGAYPRLDERYTLYGRVTEGLEVVDRIRVGDRTLSVTLE